jgi:hypothetical protein
MKEKGFVIHQDSKRVVIATMSSSNIKTGNIVSTWILQKELEPHIAVKEGKDTITCGSCPLASGNGCYVTTHQAPLGVYRAWKRGNYSSDYAKFLKSLEGRKVRLGAYGDPSYIPLGILDDISKNCEDTVGYTHQWSNRNFDGRYLKYLMASVDNENQLQYLHAKFGKVSYFRIVDSSADLKEGERVCDSEASGVECVDCMKCNPIKNFSVVITKHGIRKNKVVTK